MAHVWRKIIDWNVPSFKILLTRIIIGSIIGWLLAYSQKVKGAQHVPDTMHDILHHELDILNKLLSSNKIFSQITTAFSSLVVDLSIGYLCLVGLFGTKTWRTLASLLLVLIVRQMCQFIVILPVPDNMCWDDPGFPSAIVDYTVSNDFFYSGHTSLTVLCSLVMFRDGDPLRFLWWAFFVPFQIVFLLASRTHWAVDIVAGFFAPFCIEWFTGYIWEGKPWKQGAADIGPYSTSPCDKKSK